MNEIISKPLVILDFDGVLFDTVKEAYCSAMIATGKNSSIHEIHFETEHYRVFKKHRYLITAAWTYFYLLKAIGDYFERHTVIDESFAMHMNKPDKRAHESFENKFFAARDMMKKLESDAWILLNTPYPFFHEIKEIIKGYEYPDNFYLITTKDKDTVLELFALYKMSFHPDNIFGRDLYKRYRTKKNIIEGIMQEYNSNGVIFIDDSRIYLNECMNIQGIKLFQPEWGYVAPGDRTSDQEKIVNAILNYLRGS